MNFESFREEDTVRALKEQICAVDCLQAVVDHITKGEFSLAMQRVLDAEQSVMELMRLAGKKTEQDRLSKLIEELTKKGLDVQRVVEKIV